ncbi:MAG: hypothetical protein U1D30_04680 [Planctomycetota bacterium]
MHSRVGGPEMHEEPIPWLVVADGWPGPLTAALAGYNFKSDRFLLPLRKTMQLPGSLCAKILQATGPEDSP